MVTYYKDSTPSAKTSKTVSYFAGHQWKGLQDKLPLESIRKLLFEHKEKDKST